ncbi:Uncharacterised protein [Mycobacterium tuberculosis]|nr:Uncharacterised protein [Mycobacterium tuberculosis]
MIAPYLPIKETPFTPLSLSTSFKVRQLEEKYCPQLAVALINI